MKKKVNPDWLNFMVTSHKLPPASSAAVQHGGGRCHCKRLSESSEETGSQAEPPLDLFSPLLGGLGP